MIPSDLTVIQQRVLDCVPALNLPPDAHVLDAPCGGTAALTVALQKSGLSAVGADVDLDAAVRLGSSFVQGNLDAPLPWRDDTFDAVFSTEGIEHLENQFAFLREIHRVLKPGGTLLLTTPNITALRSRMRFFASGFFGRDSRPMNESARHPLHHIGLLTFPELRYALHTSGFQLTAISHTHIKPVSYFYGVFVPWMWVYTKIAFHKEKDPVQRERNRQVHSALYSRSLLFGECLMVTARKSA
ncbi:MAG TPA: methyltransferase domain-containing protein [Candidatus Dormibacteraeota bacterium]|nr:methyltransferase domain-containing protein [Candidatus Dormibacteraeota bacterium]